MIRYTVTANFNSAILNHTRRRQIISTASTRIAKKLKATQVQKNLAPPKTGRFYRRRGIPGATRWHQASARGEYPAQITMNLVNSILDRKQNDAQHSVFVDDTRAPYGKWLTRPRLGRKIIPFADVQEFNRTQIPIELRALIARLKGA